MKPLIFNAKALDALELEILRNISLKGLLPFDLKINHQNQSFEFVPIEVASLQSLESYLHHYKPDLLFVKKIVFAMMSMTHQVRQYLLTPERLVFDKAHVFYDPLEDYFYFCYVPECQTSHFSDALNLLRDLSIEYDLFQWDWFPKHLLKQKDFSLERFYDALSVKAIKREKNIWGFIQGKKLKKEGSPLESKFVIHAQRAFLIEKNLNPLKYPLYFEKNTIGTGDHCSVVIKGEGINFEHALVFYDYGKYHVSDLKSLYGSFLNGEKIASTMPLVNGDILQIGFKEFVFIH